MSFICQVVEYLLSLSTEGSYGVAIQMKATGQYFHLVLCHRLFYLWNPCSVSQFLVRIRPTPRGSGWRGRCHFRLPSNPVNTDTKGTTESVRIRDGPLEKLWGEGNFRAAGILFVIKFLLWNFFRSLHEYFLGLIGVHEFFSFSFPLREYFFVLRPPPPPPPPNKFSNGPSLNRLSVSSGSCY